MDPAAGSDHMRIGVLTTSWPGAACPWAGHFVADQAAELAQLGHEVWVVAPRFRGEGPLEGRPNVVVTSVRVPWSRGVLKRRPVRGLMTLWAMAYRASQQRVDRWWCHWWPTLMCARGPAERAVLLHGSDMDLLERLPRWVARFVSRRARVAAVSEGIADRFEARTSGGRVTVLPLGAHRAKGGARGTDIGKPRGRVLTVAREAPGKGLDVAHGAKRLCPQVHWEILTPADGLGPAEIRAAIASSDLVVVPSIDGAGLPKEGRPHVLVQAVVAGVPLVGGPNVAVREAIRQWGQFEVTEPGPEALAAAVKRALEPSEWTVLAARALDAGQHLTWPAVTRRVQAWLRG
jgi:glycosyltransferase involved in cell wall biosynthesis